MSDKLNTVLLVLILIGLGTNFYVDGKRYAELKNIVEAKANTTKQESSPFDQAPKDPVYEGDKPPVGPVTTISFDRTEHDFGKIEEAAIYKTAFKFTNTGSEDLIISDAVGSCGCTVPSWPQEPIKPGKSAEIKVQFDTHGRMGENLKTVTVTSNTNPSKTVLNVRSTVTPLLK